MRIKTFHLAVYHPLTKLLLLVLFPAILCQAQAVNSQRIELPPPENSSHWQQMLKNPASGTTFFLANSQGKIVIYDDQQQASPLLDIKLFYPKLIALTALTTHPSFNLSQQLGFNTFYSAHIQENDDNSPQLQPRNFSAATPYELVISKWQLAKNTASPAIAQDKHKIILRIAVPTTNIKVKQLAFNPFIQSWQDNYGQLFIVLAAEAKYHSQPLYSGAILRILPEKFGSKNYRVPQSNPFIEQQNINNEVLATNLATIHSIYWLKSHTDQLIINHSADEALQWSNITVGSDFVPSSNKAESFYNAPDTAISNSLVYRGNQFKQHRNKSIYLKKQTEWQLVSLSSQPPYQESVLQTFSLSEISTDAKLKLILDHQDEPMIINQSANTLLPLAGNYQQNAASIPQSVLQQGTTEDQLYLLAGLLLLTAGTVLFVSKRSALSAIKKYLHSRYAKFEVSDAHIALYQRHNNEPSCQLDFKQIIESSIYLNGEAVCLVNAQPENAFSNQQEHALLAAIAKEKREKMIDSRVRKCELQLIDNNNNHYRICNYLRQGNQRLTKAKFDQAIEQLIDWSWKISTNINPEHTEARKSSNKPENKLIKKHSSTVNVDDKQPTASLVACQKASSETSATDQASHANSPTPLNTTKVELRQTASLARPNNSNAQQALQQDLANLSIVEALEKLAKLKQQNLLTDEEFEQAKSKLLNVPDGKS